MSLLVFCLHAILLTFLSPVAGHPKVAKCAVLDIITPDIKDGPTAAAAEILTIVKEVLNSFPTLDESYQIHISHTSRTFFFGFSLDRALMFIHLVADLALKDVPENLRGTVVDAFATNKQMTSQKRTTLHSQGVPRSVLDDLGKQYCHVMDVS